MSMITTSILEMASYITHSVELKLHCCLFYVLSGSTCISSECQEYLLPGGDLVRIVLNYPKSDSS